MSCRLFVKNLPKEATEKKIREFFAEKGTVSDVSMKFTPEGKFRRFAFIGFESAEEAENAQKYFDKTFMGTSRLHVEISNEFSEKPPKWSDKFPKHKPTDIEDKQKQAAEEKASKQKDQKKRKDFIEEVFGALPEDDKFKEFIAVNSGEKLVWANDEEKVEHKTAKDEDEPQQEPEDRPVQKKLPETIFPNVVVVRNLSFKWKRKDLKDFFKDLSVCSIRKCLRAGVRGVAYVAFKTEEDMNKALEMDKCFLERRRIHVLKYVDTEQRKAKREEENRYRDKEVAPDVITDTGRLFIRNLPYTTTEEELEALFKPFGPIAELHLSIDSITKKPKGFAFVTFVLPEHAIKAHQALDYTTFHGRLMHIIPGMAKPEGDPDLGKGSSFKNEKEAKLKANAGSVHLWNSLFLGANAVADVMAEKFSMKKMDILGSEKNDSVAVRMALGETQIVNETKEFLEQHGVDLSVFKQNVTERSKTILLVKNLPAGTGESILWELFDNDKKAVRRVVLPPSGVTALVEFGEAQEARSAFKRLAYTMFKDQPMYLEWAPVNVFNREATDEESKKPEAGQRKEEAHKSTVTESMEKEESQEVEGVTLFVKNLNFATTDKEMMEHFGPHKALRATVATKMDPKNRGTLSMGYGFVEFANKEDAMNAMKKLQHSKLDSHTLELKVSRRETEVAGTQNRKQQKLGQASTKILVRNVPFQANKKEICELFGVFGTLANVRLPRKMFGGDSGEHRGFAFVEFATKSDAKLAFNALSQSTHLYGRRLVLEWASEEDEEVEALRKKTAEQFSAEPAAKKLRKVDLKNTLDGTGDQ